ncbi:YggS family pyridoxal phosphate-dependent enzyme [bacterium]|nr:YggS family pyridoxal phosphate-dependent enzyme [bacterium]
MNNIKKILEETKNVTIVAATKYVDSTIMRELYSNGINNFGENRVQDLLKKQDELKDLNIIWHFIGHLQRNKAAKIINKIDYLHSLDSLKLAEMIEKNRTTKLKCFVELSLTDSPTKNGVKEENLEYFMNSLREFKNIEVIGFMAMTDKNMNDYEKQNVFKRAKLLKDRYYLPNLSMGMSDDYKIAIVEGATFIRLGRILFSCE